MAFQTSRLPSLAAAALDVSSLAQIAISWRKSSIRIAKPEGLKNQSSGSAAKAQTSSSSHSLEKSTPSIGKPEQPDFLRDASLSPPTFSSSALVPLDIGRDITSIPLRSLNMAKPLVRGSYTSLMSRPLGVSLIRRMHTSRPPSFVWPSTRRPLQHRGFGTGSVSRSLLASREATANRTPSNAEAQNSFYQALLKANMPAIVVERYQSGRFARDEATDQAYEAALSMLNGAFNGVSFSPMHAGNGLNPAQLQALSQAVAAQQQGSQIAVAQGGMGAGNKDGRIHVVVDESTAKMVFGWIKFILKFGALVYISLLFVNVVIDSLGTIRRPGGRLENSEVKAESQKARFADVHGCDEAKEELQELVEFLRNPEKFSTLGGKLPRGVLLVGPPGTGKTLLARAVAGEAGVPFFYMSGSEFDEIYVGVGAKRVRELFTAAKAKSPAIVFIDELDAIGGRRNSRDAAYAKQTLNQLLTELDGFDQDSGVIIIAATNFPDLLDKALVRPGRFDRHVAVDLPDVRGRIAILHHHAKKTKLASDVNLQAIASATSGLSGADLENIVNQAAVRAGKSKAKWVTHQDFDWAKDKVIMGAERKSMIMSVKEKEMTAYHEAGHALVSYYSKAGGRQLYKVTILPRGQTLGHTAILPEMDKYSYNVTDFLTWIDVNMGGKIAEEIAYGNEQVSSGCSHDLESATKIAWSIVGRYGMSEKLGPVEYMENYQYLSPATKSMVEAEVKRVLEESYDRARELLLSKRKELDLLAKALLEYETLDKAEVTKVIRGEKLTDRRPTPGPMAVPRPPDPFGPSGIPGLTPLPGVSGDEERPHVPPPVPPPAAVA